MDAISISNCIELDNIAAKLQQQHLPIRTLYKLSRLFQAIKKPVQNYREALAKVIRECGELDEAGKLKVEEGNYQIKPDKRDEFQEQVSSLLGWKVDVPDISFSAEELEGLDLSLSEFQEFLPFIKE